MDTIRKIVTHGGIFHCDEVMAVAILLLLHKVDDSTNSLIVERRPYTMEDVEDKEVVLVDIGDRYQPELNNFDHHQSLLVNELRKETHKYMASAGLIWKHFGKELIINMLQCNDAKAGFIAAYVDDKIVRYIDAIDIGKVAKGSRKRHDHTLTFSMAISVLNSKDARNRNTQDTAFNKAVNIIKTVLQAFIDRGKHLYEAHNLIMQAELYNDHILVLEEYVPYEISLYKRQDQEKILFVIHPSARGGYNIQQVCKSKSCRLGRVVFPMQWGGMKGKDLADLIPGITGHKHIFCHIGRFIAGADTMEDAKVMAEAAIALSANKDNKTSNDEKNQKI